MADLPLPDQPVTPPVNPVIPPVPSSNSPAPSVDTPEPNEPEESTLAALSPFKILQKKGTATVDIPQSTTLPNTTSTPPQPSTQPPATPPPATAEPVDNSPLSVDLDRDELLKQAAAAPEHTFILPSIAAAAVPTPPLEKPQPIVVPKPTVPTPPASQPKPAVPLPPVQKHPTPPVIPTKPVTPPQTPPPSKPIEFPLKGATPVPKHSHVTFAIIGAIIALAALVGGLYVLADNGMRIPVLYTAISGLKPSAVQASADALAKNKTHSSYQYQATLLVQQQKAGSDSTSTQSATTPLVYSLNASVPYGQFTNAGVSQTSRFDVASNGGGTTVPVVLRTSGQNTAAYFPDGTSGSTITVNNANLANTLMQPILVPLSAETVLGAVKAETAYQKKTILSSPIASYNVTYNCAGLQNSFPTGSALSNCTGMVAFYWKTPNAALTGLLAASSVQVTLVYKGGTYSYDGEYRYSGWDQALGDTMGDLVLINNVDLSTIPSTTNMNNFISSLGINYAGLAHDSSLDSGIAQLPITPTGLTVSVPQTPLTNDPPVPAQPATAAAQARDVQRKHDLQDLQSALEAYKKDNGSYPVSSPGGDQVASSQALFNALVPKYLTAMPVDPLKDTYYYLYISPSTPGTASYDLRSVLEDASDSTAVKGSTYAYFNLYNP